MPDSDHLSTEELLDAYARHRLRQQVLGPIISLAVHVFVIGGMALFLTQDPIKQALPPVEVTITKLKIHPLDPTLKEDLKAPESVFSDIAVPTMEPPDMPTPSTEALPSSEPTLPGTTEAPVTSTLPMGEMPDVLAELSVIETGSSLKIPMAFASRMSAESREKSLKDHGGSIETEAAVLRALAWLRDNQNPDGSWSKSKPEAMTALGLLAFLAHGENPSSEEFGRTVQLASQYLVASMMAISEENPPLDQYWPYQNGMMTYALAESYALSHVPLVKVAMEKGLRFIVKGQQPGGGWDYQYCQGARWDLTATTWQMQALKAGYTAGSDTPGVYQALDRGGVFLREIAWKNGRFQWVPLYPGDWGVQGCGVLCMQLTGHGRSKEAKIVVERIFERGMEQFKGVKDKLYWQRHNPYYDWYYETQVMFHAGSTTWRKWNRGYSKVLMEMQHDDGHWQIPGEGSQMAEWDPYQTTALNCLSLQVYYRYLPSYKEQHPPRSQHTDSALDTIQNSVGIRFEKMR